MESVPECFRQGLEFQERGLFDLAIQEYNKALELDPDNLDVLVNLGAAYLQKGLPERSTQILNRALSRKPDHPLALFNLGKAYLYREDAEKALETFEKARLVMPSDLDVHKSIAQCLSLLGRKSEAVDLLLAIKEQILTDQPTMIFLGHLLMELSRFSEGMEVFRKTVTAFPDSAQALDGLIRCQLELGMKDKAATSLRRALMVYPLDPGFNLMMIDLMLENGEIEDAVSLLRKAIAGNPDNQALRKKMDEVSRKMPVLKKRAGKPELVQKTSRFETEVYDILDGLYDGRVSIEVAVKSLKELRSKDPTDLFIADELANLLFQAKNYEEAMDLYGEIQKSAPNEPKHRVNFSKCLALSGNLSVAKEYLEDAIKNFPGDPEIPLALVEMNLLQRNFDEASRILGKVMVEYPDDVHGLFLQGYIALRTGNYDSSAEIFRKLVSFKLNDEEVAVWFSRAMIFLGLPDEALSAWDQFDDGIRSLLEILTRIELNLTKGNINAVKSLLGNIGNYEPRFLEDHLMFGKAYFFARDFKNAESEFELVLKQDPEHPEALAFIAMIFLMKSKTAKFWMLWQKAIETDSFYAVLTALVLLKTLNYPQLERLKNETLKILGVSVRNDLDKARISLLLKRISL